MQGHTRSKQDPAGAPVLAIAPSSSSAACCGGEGGEELMPLHQPEGPPRPSAGSEVIFRSKSMDSGQSPEAESWQHAQESGFNLQHMPAHNKETNHCVSHAVWFQRIVY